MKVIQLAQTQTKTPIVHVHRGNTRRGEAKAARGPAPVMREENEMEVRRGGSVLKESGIEKLDARDTKRCLYGRVQIMINTGLAFLWTWCARRMRDRPRWK
jgi:hypothetical protein